MVTNWSVQLEKRQTIDFMRRVDFYAFLKMLHFQNFEDFLNLPVAPGKIVKCT